MRTRTKRTPMNMGFIVDESTNEEQLNALVEIIAKNEYTGEIVYMNDEDDADYLGAEDEITFIVRNKLTGVVKVFYSAIEAFEYKYNTRLL